MARSIACSASSRAQHRRYRAEELFASRRHLRSNVREQRRRIERSGCVGRQLAAQQQARAVGDAGFHLAVKILAQIQPGQRPERRIRRERRTHHDGAQAGEHRIEKLIVYAFHDDKTLRRDAALTTVDQPTADADGRRGRDVGVGQDDRGIAAAQFQHGRLQGRSGARSDRATGPGAAGETHGPNQLVIDQLAGAFVIDIQIREERRLPRR